MKNVRPDHAHPIVVLDPGHYGDRYNRGAAPGCYESDRMWILAQLQAEQMRRIGIEVILTRTKQNQDKGLIVRGRMAKGADIFESLHSNACDTPSVDRPVGIYLVDDGCGPIDEQSKAFASLMAKSVRDCMDTDDPASITCRKSNNDRDGDGKRNDDYYGVLYGAHQVGTAAIIMEHSFHTNPRMAEWMMSADNLKRLALAKTAAYAEWFGIPMEVIASVPAAEKEADVAGQYRVTAVRLNIRDGAGTQHAVLIDVPEDTILRSYGYYTRVDGIRWLYVRLKHGGITYTGFCSEKYLEKVVTSIV